MACGASTAVMTSFEDPVLHRSYGTFTREQLQRRRHSSNHISPWTVDGENVQLLVCGYRMPCAFGGVRLINAM
jgi:adiponectin receptor